MTEYDTVVAARAGALNATMNVPLAKPGTCVGVVAVAEGALLGISSSEPKQISETALHHACTLYTDQWSDLCMSQLEC